MENGEQVLLWNASYSFCSPQRTEEEHSEVFSKSSVITDLMMKDRVLWKMKVMLKSELYCLAKKKKYLGNERHADNSLFVSVVGS